MMYQWRIIVIIDFDLTTIHDESPAVTPQHLFGSSNGELVILRFTIYRYIKGTLTFISKIVIKTPFYSLIKLNKYLKS